MSWLTNWFGKKSTQIILKSALQILKVLAFGMGEKLWQIAVNAVCEVEQTHPHISGVEKAKRVSELIKKEIPGIKSHLVNLAIELAVAFMKEQLLEKKSKV
jgi:hypothetical protein